MSPFILFGLLLVLTFAALVFFLKPSSTEAAVEQHLAGIEQTRTQTDAGTSILKPEGLSSNPFVDNLLKQLPGSSSISRLIRQAGRQWSVGSVLACCLTGALVVWWIASYILPTAILGMAAGIGAVLRLYSHLSTVIG